MELEDQRKADHYMLAEVTRFALEKYFNWNSGPSRQITKEKIWPLPYDKVESDTEPSREQKIIAIQEIAERIKRKKRG
jgi:hypothetical protein